MPVSFLSTTQRERYGRYPDTLSGEELARYFQGVHTLDRAHGARGRLDDELPLSALF